MATIRDHAMDRRRLPKESESVMASVYKRKQDKGKKRQCWYIGYKDRHGKRQTLKGFTDKSETEKLAAKLEHDEALRAKGLIDPEQEKLAAQKQMAIAKAIDGFEVKQSKNSEKHATLTVSRIRRIVDESAVAEIGQLSLENVECAIGQIIEDDGSGPKTYNHYAQAMNSFCNWLVATKRLAANPLVGMERMNTEVDVRHRRRALTSNEFSSLVASARQSGIKIQGYSPEQRARVYLIAYYTGLRRKEISTLKPESFDLESEQPIFKVKAACSKHRKEDTLPIHPELLALLQEWLPNYAAGKELFPKLEKKKTWLMVKKDLERVGIAYKTEEGFADFHAAGRHTHITELLRNGTTLPEAWELARHSDVRMTMRYTHIGLDDQAKAIKNLPAINSDEELGASWECAGGVEEQNLTSDGDSPTDEDSPQSVEQSSVSNQNHPMSSQVKSGGGGPALFARFIEVCGRFRNQAMQFGCSIVTHRPAFLGSCSRDHVRIEPCGLQNVISSNLRVVPK